MNRREFVTGAARAGIVATLSAGLLPARAKELDSLLLSTSHDNLADSARDEAFWEQVKQAYQLPGDYLYLNNGGASPSAQESRVVKKGLDEEVREAPSVMLWRRQFKAREEVRLALAELLECEAEHVSLMRNTTEALATVIQGLDLPPGSEILTSTDDYPTMLHTIDMYARRRNWAVNMIQLPRPLSSPAEVSDLILSACTPQTRLVLLSDILFKTGERMPIAQICERLKEKDLLIAIDGAHTVGQFPVNPASLGCHFFASSLHKWLSAPIGTGMLWVHPEKIQELWPVTGYIEGQENDIRKFEHQGTRPFSADLAVTSAIRFQNYLGTERKLARLQYLTRYWWDQVSDIEGLQLRTNIDSEESFGAILSFTAPQTDRPLRLDRWLFSEHNIVIGHMGDSREDLFRISPHVFTMPSDLDRLVKGIREYYG